MPAPAVKDAISLVISPDRTSVQLIVPAEFPRHSLSALACTAVLQQHNISVSAEVKHEVEKLVATAMEESKTFSAVVAREHPPVHGEDGWVEWLVDQKKEEEPSDEHHEGEVCHYSKCTFIMVKPGDVVAVVHPPTVGSDGSDILGKTLAAKDGKPAALDTDDTLIKDGKNRLMAQKEGVLVRSEGKASIREQIEVPEYVDFSTGNIDFKGDVLVQKGVRDKFLVKATGNIEVMGLIEAASIHCGGDLLSRGGFAGREQGHARVGRNLVARYLDNIEAQIAGDLLFEREVINCQIATRGNVKGEHGAIIGGMLQASGTIEVGSIGSGAGVPTEIILGSVPWLEPLESELETITKKAQEQLESLLQEQKRINQAIKNKRATSVDKESLTEISFEIGPLTEIMQRSQAVLEILRARIKERRKIELTVCRKLNPGAMLYFENRMFKVHEECKGPLRVLLRGKDLVVQRGDSPPFPLTDIADMKMSRL